MRLILSSALAIALLILASGGQAEADPRLPANGPNETTIDIETELQAPGIAIANSPPCSKPFGSDAFGLSIPTVARACQEVPEPREKVEAYKEDVKSGLISVDENMERWARYYEKRDATIRTLLDKK